MTSPSSSPFDSALDSLRLVGHWHGRVVHGRRNGDAVHILASTTLLTDRTGSTVGAISVNRETSAGPTALDAAPADPALAEDIRRGLRDGEFTVHYQQIVRLEDATPIGVEALARWDHPARGLLAPADFIAAAEVHGLIGDLGHVVLEAACAQMQRWRREGLDLYVSINVSACQLADELLPRKIVDVLTEHGMNPADLWIEITESALVEDLAQARRCLGRIHELGVQVSIDDFGIGWPSLTYLRDFPVNALKIDRVFVDGLGRRPRDLAIARSIIALGQELGLGVIAEGVETFEQRARLYQLGCDTGQGYLFGRPTSAETLNFTPSADVSSSRPATHPALARFDAQVDSTRPGAVPNPGGGGSLAELISSAASTTGEDLVLDTSSERVGSRHREWLLQLSPQNLPVP